MADGTKFNEVLQKVLENLNSEDLMEFQKQLVKGEAGNFPAIPKSKLLGTTVPVTVSEMVQAYVEKTAVEVCETVLININHRNLAQSLAGIKGSLHPVVPYEQVLYDWLKNQTVITVQGEVKKDAKRFHISLYKDDDIAFHFNPRFNQGEKQVIVRNSLIGNVWGSEEREHSSFPFTPGEAFELKILCTDFEFRVNVGEKHLLDFTHRIKDLDQIRKLKVDEGVFIKRVTIDPLPLWVTTPSAYVLNGVSIKNKSITIPGHVKPNAKTFTINVVKDKDIYFHFKPYFSEDGKGTVIVRNRQIGGVWGSEERETPLFPFAQGKQFLVKILFTDMEFKVYVNGSHLLDFKNRQFDITKINTVELQQDVLTWGVQELLKLDLIRTMFGVSGFWNQFFLNLYVLLVFTVTPAMVSEGNNDGRDVVSEL